jgi:hypothetical protein
MTQQETFDVVTEMRIMKHDLKNFEQDVKDHIRQGEQWRLAIVGVVFAILMQIGGAIYVFGQLNNRICRTEAAIDKLISVVEKTNNAVMSR